MANTVYRFAKKSSSFRAVSSHRLVPGDVVLVLRGKVTCDLVLLQGSCLVEESMLSGEVRRLFPHPFAQQTSCAKSDVPDTKAAVM